MNTNTKLQKCHGTLISDLSEKGSGARIRWPANARLLMYAHLARHKLHLGNCQNHRFSELVKSLDLDQGVEFNTAVHPRLQSALKYSLESLSKMGHVELSRGSQRRHVAIWEPHTDEWAKPGWDGSLGGPENEESDSGDEMSLDIEYTQPVQLSSPEFQLSAQNQVANVRRDNVNQSLLEFANKFEDTREFPRDHAAIPTFLVRVSTSSSTPEIDIEWQKRKNECKSDMVIHTRVQQSLLTYSRRQQTSRSPTSNSNLPHQSFSSQLKPRG